MHHHIIGKGVVAKQLSQFATKIDEPLADVEVVLAIVVDANGILGHIHLLTQLAAGGIGHERRKGRMVESEHPAFFLSFAGGQGSGFTSGIGQTVEIGLVGNMQFKGFVFLQQIL